MLSPARITVALLAVTVLAMGSTAFTATNTVPATRAGTSVFAITANTLKPASCNAITLTTIATGTGTFTTTASAELVLGSAAVDTINAAGGNDCVLGGGGNDALQGGAGIDVCIGGPGVDTFNANCETQIQ